MAKSKRKARPPRASTRTKRGPAKTAKALPKANGRGAYPLSIQPRAKSKSRKPSAHKDKQGQAARLKMELERDHSTRPTLEQLASAHDELKADNEELQTVHEELRAAYAELALRESENRYRQLIQSLPAAVYTCDAEGRVTMFNEAAAKLWGREPEVGRDLWCGSWKIHTPDGAPLPLDQCPMALAVREGRPSRDQEIIIERPDGELRYVLANPEPILDASGAVVGAVNTLIDITNRRLAEQETQRQARNLTIINQVAATLAGELDLQRLVQSVTDAGTELTTAQFGAFFHTVKDRHGERFTLYTISGVPIENFAKFPVPRNTELFGPTFRGEKIVRLDDVTQDPDYGKNKPHHGMPEGHLPVRSYLAIPVVSRSGESIGGLFFGHENAGVFTAEHEQIMAGVAAQAAIAIDNARLFQESWRLAAIVESTSEVVIGKDNEGVIHSWNEAASEAYGYSAQEAVGKHISLIVPVDKRGELQNILDRVRRGDSIVNLETHRVRKDGHRLDVRVTISPVRDNEGRVVGASAIGRDITEQRRVRAALLETTSRLTAIIETAVDGIVTIDERGRVGSLNPAAVKMFGYGPQEVIGRNVNMLMPEPYRSEHNSYLENYLETGIRKIIGIGREVVGRRKDGTTFPMDLAVSETTVGDRQLFTGIVRDISAKKAAEETLRIHARQQAVVAKLGELAVRERDVQTVFDHATAAVADALAVEYCKVLELLPGERELLLRAGMGWKEGLVGHAAVGSGTASQAGYTLLVDEPVIVEDIHRDERFHPPPLLLDHGVVSGMTTVIRGVAGAPWGVLGAHSSRRIAFTENDVHFLVAVADILGSAVRRQRAEKRLQESEERFRRMADTAPVMIWLSGLDKKCHWFNRSWLDFTGRSLEEELGDGWAEGVHPEDLDRCVSTYVSAFDARQPFEMEYRLRRRDGEYRWIVDHGTPQRVGDEFIGYIGSCMDISDRKRAEEELGAQHDNLERLVQERTGELQKASQRLRLSERMASIGTLAAGLGHDIGNLLLPIRLRATFLERAGLAPAVLEHVNDIKVSTDYLQRLAKGLQLLAMDPEHRPPMERVDLAPWWKDAESVLRNVLPRGIELKADFSESAPWVTLNKAALTQVVFNLVQNAGDAMRRRERGVVTVWCEPGEGDTVRLGITDNGPGMAAEVKARCMEPFFTTKPRGISTGLGLVLVYSLVRDAGGEISIESEEGRGTTFVLTLPSPKDGAGPEHQGETIVSVTLADARLRAIVTAELKSLHCTAAEDGQRPDIVITDDPGLCATDGAPVVFLGAEAPRGVIDLGKRPRPAAIREALKKAVADAKAHGAETGDR